MIKYSGGKQRIGKDIATRVQEIERDMGLENCPYYEPMVGVGGIMMHMNTDLLDDRHRHDDEYSEDDDSLEALRRYSRSFSRSHDSRNRNDGERERLGSDANESVVMFVDAAANKGWLPPRNMTESEWNKLKHSGKPSALAGFAGCALSFGGNYMAGFSGLYDKKKSVKDYISAAKRKIEKTAPLLEGVHLRAGDYDSFKRPSGCIVLFDPPYESSRVGKPNKLFSQFDTDKFWRYAEDLSQDNLVFVCEEDAPKGWVCVWKKPLRRVTNQKKFTDKYTKQGKKAPTVLAMEKLFMFEEPPDVRAFDDPRYPW